MPSKLIRLAKLQADQAWNEYRDRQVAKTIEIGQQLQSSGYYLGYNADTGLHQITLLSGQSVEAQSITNSGQAAGDRVAVSRDGQGWRFKTMPR